jgi:TolB-like protein
LGHRRADARFDFADSLRVAIAFACSYARGHPVPAVLPLDNLSGDASQNYFADGMTDELITDLAQISALRVISRTSVMAYKGARKPTADRS